MPLLDMAIQLALLIKERSTPLDSIRGGSWVMGIKKVDTILKWLYKIFWGIKFLSSRRLIVDIIQLSLLIVMINHVHDYR